MACARLHESRVKNQKKYKILFIKNGISRTKKAKRGEQHNFYHWQMVKRSTGLLGLMEQMPPTYNGSDRMVHNTNFRFVSSSMDFTLQSEERKDFYLRQPLPVCASQRLFISLALGFSVSQSEEISIVLQCKKRRTKKGPRTGSRGKDGKFLFAHHIASGVESKDEHRRALGEGKQLFKHRNDIICSSLERKRATFSLMSRAEMPSEMSILSRVSR